MRLKSFTLSLLCGSIGIFTLSCQPESPEFTNDLKVSSRDASTLTTEDALLSITGTTFASVPLDCLEDSLANHLVALGATAALPSSACSSTARDKKIAAYLQHFGPMERQFFASYVAINKLAAIQDAEAQYFGAKGENTLLVAKQIKGLEKFWEMENQIKVKGQHNNTLDNRDKIAGVYLGAGYPVSVAYAIADQLRTINSLSPVFVETPLLSFDAFSTTDKKIVLGDGFLQVLSESGIPEEVSVSGVLAHEWGHQVQFRHFKPWFGVEKENFPKTPQFNRLLELEADFFTGYYLTHHKGANKSWKNAAAFFELFYNMGDCSVTANTHHGTPNQRLAAARLGYLVSLLTPGANLKATEVHTLFMAAYNAILLGSTDRQAILATLQGTTLQAVYASILKHEGEIDGIQKGQLNRAQIKDLLD